MSGVSGTARFEPKARIIKLLGEELITNEVIAVAELVKNSFDACASNVVVNLQDIDKKDDGTISVIDNGVGMSLDTVLNAWLQPGTDVRKKEREEYRKNRRCDRPILGEKGVGRFAAQKLGNLINVITKTEQDQYETNVEVNWTTFEEDKFLEDVEVKYWQSNLKHFKRDESGTIIEITWLLKDWTERMVRDLNLQLNSLNSPFPTKDFFEVILESNVYQSEIRQAPDINDIIDKSVYSFEAEINKEGFLDAKYDYFNPAFPQFERREYFMESLVENNPTRFPEGRLPKCGLFKLNFYAWDLDPASLRETVTRYYYNTMIRPYRGIKVYRDGFRVWPYGEPDDDWLSMDIRRVNLPTRHFSRNQIIGIVEISLSSNPKLRDKTDREGLIDCEELEDFKALILITLGLFENERRLDKDKVDALRERKRPEDDVYDAINDLKEKINKQNHNELYDKEIIKIESAYDRRVKDITETLLVSAGIGISYMIPAHDITDNLTLMENRLKHLTKQERISQSVIKDNLSNLLDTTLLIKDITKGVRQIGRKSTFDNNKLSNIVKDALDIIKYKLDEEEIKYEEPKIIEDSVVKCKKNLIIVALLNIIDNSTYWVKAKQKKDWALKITVDTDEVNRPRIVISDRGPGIKDPPEAIVTPFFTRKPHGSGLGLYIVDQIMKAHEGWLKFLFEGDEPSLWPGANVALIFKKELKDE
uniref:Histidine kinase n=1 Tax=uncultured marine crenarchaeote E6-3G TaxID=907719 RepID=G9BAL5_9ARCH|nr:histidine kinase [uncultured marine crenarchaeote E6-3G]